MNNQRHSPAPEPRLGTSSLVIYPAIDWAAIRTKEPSTHGHRL